MGGREGGGGLSSRISAVLLYFGIFRTSTVLCRCYVLLDSFLTVVIQDSVRLLAVEGCIAMAGLLSEESRRDLVRPVLNGLIDDKSWRVRFMVAEKLTEVRDSNFFLTRSSILPQNLVV